MTSQSSPPLPHGATGVEIGNFVIEFRADKIVIIAKNATEHYTFHGGGASGVLDIHRTWRDADDNERHQTVFAMRHADLLTFLSDLAPITTGMFRLLRRLRTGWLYRHGIGVARGLNPVTEQEIAAVTRRTPGRKRIVVDEEKFQATLQIPEYLDEICDFPDGAFSLFDGGQRIGIGIKAIDRTGFARFYWFKLRDASRFFNSCEGLFMATAIKYAIPPEKYEEYRCLEP